MYAGKTHLKSLKAVPLKASSENIFSPRILLPALFFLASCILSMHSPCVFSMYSLASRPRILPGLTYSLYVFFLLPYSSWPHVFSPCILLAYSLRILPHVRVPGLTCSLYVVFLAYSSWPHVFSPCILLAYSLRILPHVRVFSLASRVLST